MDVTIVGTGAMARSLGVRFVRGGHSVTVLGRDEVNAQVLARDLRALTRRGASVRTGWLADARIRDPIVVLAVPHAGASAVVDYLRDQLAGRIVIDVTNPFHATPGRFSSGAEELAQHLPPGARLVKAFNTVFAANLLTGQAVGQPLDVLIAGDDVSAKAQVAQLAQDGGMLPLDVGPLHHARDLEAMARLALAIRKTHALGPQSAWKLIR
jgi:predicted dinucleotide-binding enzyme